LRVGGESLFLMLIFSAVVGIILGMGMPTTPVYLILVVLIAPAIVAQGVIPLATHLFIFYFGMLSMITPPVCLASYAAAAIAKANPMRTGYYAMWIGISTFIIPFLFVYSPGILLVGSFADILLNLAKTAAGLAFFGIATVGFLFRRLDWVKRVVSGLGSLALLMPYATTKIGIHEASWLQNIGWLLNVGGLVMCLSIFFLEWRKNRWEEKRVVVSEGTPYIQDK